MNRIYPQKVIKRTTHNEKYPKFKNKQSAPDKNI